MAYVLDYSAFVYSRRRYRRNAVLAVLVSFVTGFVLVGTVLNRLCGEPTWHDLVTQKTVIVVKEEEPSDDLLEEPRIKDVEKEFPSLADLSDQAHALAEEWNGLRDDYIRMMPYLRLQWVPAPVTNILEVIATRMSDPTALPKLECVSVSVSNPKLSSWTAKTANRPRSLRLTVVWKTREGLGDTEWGQMIGAVSNWLSGVRFSKGEKPRLDHLVARTGERRQAGDSVTATYSFSGPMQLPYSDELQSVTNRIAKVSAALSAIVFGRSGAEQLSLETVLPGIEKKAFENRKEAFRRSLDPGQFLETHFPADDAHFTEKKAIAQQVYKAWSEESNSRLPWRNRHIRAVRKSPDFIGGETLLSFLTALPKVEDVQKARITFDTKILGFTNALPASLFLVVDADSTLSGAARHSTSNLLPSGVGLGLLPRKTNLPGPDSAVGSGVFTVSFPTSAEKGGQRLFVDGGWDDAVRYVFSDWTYDFASSNATVSVRDLVGRFVSFTAGGYGYEPDEVKIGFTPGDVIPAVSSFHASGLVPLALKDRKREETDPPSGGGK